MNEELNEIEIKELLVEKLGVLSPDLSVETELNQLFTQPEGKIVVMYNSSKYNESPNVALLNRVQRGNFTLMLTVRDPLQADLALKHKAKVIEIVHGLRIGPNDMQDRLFPDNDRFEEFTEGSEVWAFKIDLNFTKIVRISEENANA